MSMVWMPARKVLLDWSETNFSQFYGSLFLYTRCLWLEFLILDVNGSLFMWLLDVNVSSFMWLLDVNVSSFTFILCLWFFIYLYTRCLWFFIGVNNRCLWLKCQPEKFYRIGLKPTFHSSMVLISLYTRCLWFIISFRY
jgi:hypothetical protein